MTDIMEYAPVSADVLERLWPEPGTRPGTAWTHRQCGLVVTDQFEHDPKFGRFPCPGRRGTTLFHPAIFDVGTEKKENVMTDGTCPVILAYLPDGRTPVYCMIRTPGHASHVAHVRRDDGARQSTIEAGGTHP